MAKKSGSKKGSKKSKKKSTKKKKTKKKTKKKSSKKSKKSSKKATKKKKKSTKKAAKGKTAKAARHRVYNLTKEVPEEHYFILANGRPVKHVAELASVLDQLEDHVFDHHVSPDRNDFHNWIKHIFEDVELARKIAGVDEKKKLQLVIYRHLAGHE